MKLFKASDALPADLQHAYDYFKRGGQKAADEFVERFEDALRTIRAHPHVCRSRPSGWRQLPILRSSYAIFYRETPSFWLIGGVVSTVQDPDAIQAQLLIREIRNDESEGG